MLPAQGSIIAGFGCCVVVGLGPQSEFTVKSLSLFDLSGRVAVVVGGTSGIGRALALGLADAGADVVATGRRENLVKDVSAEIEKRGRRSLAIACDVEETGSLERVRDACVTALGGVDILIAAAGTT